MLKEVKTETEAEDKNEESVFTTLSKIDVSKYVKDKGGLYYLPWATAWGLVKAHYPDADYSLTMFDEIGKDGLTGRKVPWMDTRHGVLVEATVTIDSKPVGHSQLYVMDYRNHVIANPDIAQINKAQLRCLVKALAYAGLGLNLYAGEDLPSDSDETITKPKKASKQKAVKQPNQPPKQNKEDPRIKTAKEKIYQTQDGDAISAYNLFFKADAEKNRGGKWVDFYHSLLKNLENKKIFTDLYHATEGK